MIRAGLVALCLLAVVACSSEEEPEPLPPVAAPSASPTPPAIPSEAVPDTPQGAAAFARFYLELLNQAFAEGDATTVRALSDPGCGTCMNLIGAIEEKPSLGERVEGGDYEVVFAEAPPVEAGDVIVDVRYSLTEVRVYGPDGALLRSTPAQTNIDSQIRLLRGADAWFVAGFRSVAS